MAVDALGTRVPFRALEFPRFPQSDFQNFGLKTPLLLGSMPQGLALYLVPELPLAARPLLSALRTHVRHRSMSERCQTQTSFVGP